MKTKTIKLYEYKELSESAKEKAKRWWIDGMDFQFEWDCLKEDAETVGIKLEEWDYGRYLKLSLTLDFSTVLANILANHGERCETYKTAKRYQTEYAKFTDEEILDCKDEDLREEFTKDIAEDYRVLADEQYDYVTSEEGIAEVMEVNEYTFLEDGTRFN